MFFENYVTKNHFPQTHTLKENLANVDLYSMEISYLHSLSLFVFRGGGKNERREKKT